MKMSSDASIPVGEEIRQVVEEIVGLLQPVRVYLYNHRLTLEGKSASFKLCIIAAMADKQRAERSIYLDVDSPIPFDILLYTPQEWEALLEQRGSFAGKIAMTGMVVYE